MDLALSHSMRTGGVLILFTLTMAFAAPVFADTLLCTSDTVRSSIDESDSNFGLLVLDLVTALCTDAENGRYRIELGGFGLALRIASHTSLRVVCNLPIDEMPGNYSGGRIQIAPILGLSLGIFYSSEKRATCVVRGIGLEFGGSITFSTLRIFRRFPHPPSYEPHYEQRYRGRIRP